MIKKKDFLKEYNIEKETLKKTGMKWEELNSIYDSYCRLEPQLKKIGKDFVNDYLYDIEKAGIHSYRYRTKKAGHLLEKIIRKKSEQSIHGPDSHVRSQQCHAPPEKKQTPRSGPCAHSCHGPAEPRV